VSEFPVSGPARLELADGWELACGAVGDEAGPEGLDRLTWTPARVPGTVAGALGASPDGGNAAIDLDADDWWFRTRFDAEPAGAGERVVLKLGGVATVADVYLNGELVLASESMFATHELDVGDSLRGANELAICCRALGPRLRQRRRPRARWRTRLVGEGNLRFYRTMLLGRAPGFAPGPAVVGPWRPVSLERSHGAVLAGVRLRARVAGEDGLLDCRASVHAPPGTSLPQSLIVTVATGRGSHGGELAAQQSGQTYSGELTVEPVGGTAGGTVRVAGAELWWPHTHGRPMLYDVTIADGDRCLHRARVGFRRLDVPGDLVPDGLDLRINGVPVFARGAVWTPLELSAKEASEAVLRRVLERVVDAGMNMLRVPGIGAYESDTFHDLCDELGILVWQDFMFANLDYPEQDVEFMRIVETEARAVLDRLGSRPSLAALCGGSEVAQQVAMLGLDPGLANGPLYGELLPRLVAEAEVPAPYLPSTPWGGDLPFRPDRGVANYYGVGAYLRPLQDARLAEVKFAGECLAFANVPDEPALEALHAPGGLSVSHPAWKAGVPRDAGAGWDFDDVRDHYLKLLFDVDPVALRSVDQDRYLELSRAVSGEVMAETFGEWRRAASPCHGALVLWLKDLAPGAGWGVLDHRGQPKVAYHHLRRVLAPVAVWSTDEGLGGVDVHVANDGPEPLVVRLRVALYRDFEVLVDEAVQELELQPHGGVTRNLEALLGRFVDPSWAYRFGPPAQDLIALSLERARDGATELLSQAFRFPAGRPPTAGSAGALGLRAAIERHPGEGSRLRVASTRFAYGVRISAEGAEPSDDAFGVEPGHERLIALRAARLPGDGSGSDGGAVVTALNLRGRIRVPPPARAPG
jgi:beta-mannosidase